MKKYILLTGLALLVIGIAGCGITTGQFTIVFDIDGIASTDEAVNMQMVDLNEEEVYQDHQDNLRDVESVAIVAIITNNSNLPASGEVWVSTNDSYTTAEEITSADDAKRIFSSPAIPAGEDLMINWEDSYAHMENVDYLEDLIINGGTFTVYGLADETPFDVYIDAEIVITFTAGL